MHRASEKEDGHEGNEDGAGTSDRDRRRKIKRERARGNDGGTERKRERERRAGIKSVFPGSSSRGVYTGCSKQEIVDPREDPRFSASRRIGEPLSSASI